MTALQPPTNGLARLRRQIRPGARLPVYRLWLTFGALTLIFSELVVWQNPPARAWYDWIVLYVLYTALGAIFLDLVARFQVRTPAALGLASGIYGAAVSAVIHYTAYRDIPIGFVVQGLGLQVGAGFLALMLFLVVFRGRNPGPLQIAAAAALGAAWGLWTHWYPLQEDVAWGLVSLESAQIYLVLPLIGAGVLLAVLPARFATLREGVFVLRWWEMLAVGTPIFAALLIGMFNNHIPAIPLLIPAVVIAFCGWALRWQRPEYDPSALAEITIAAPNMITYTVLTVVFLFAGSLAYPLVTDADSPVGVALYIAVLGFGSAWLPFACGLIFWSVLRTRLNPELQESEDSSDMPGLGTEDETK